MTRTVFESYGSSPLDLEDSPLRRYYGIEPAHVRSAIAMMRNLFDTMEVEYRARDQVTFTPTTTLPAIQLLSLRPPPPHLLAGALQSVGPYTATVYADPLAIMPTHGQANGQIYGFDPATAPTMGAALALHVVRVHLARLAKNPRGRAWLDSANAALDEARALVSSYVGDHWVEFTRHSAFECDTFDPDWCPGNPMCPATPPDDDAAGYLCPGGEPPEAGPLSGLGYIDVYFDAADLAFAADLDDDGTDQGGIVVVSSAERAYCLRHGHLPDGSDPGCTSFPAIPLVEADENASPNEFFPWARPAARDRIGYEQRRFRLEDPESWQAPSADGALAANAYVLWRTGAADAPEEEVDYILIDVIQPRRTASVHALGGRFAEMFVDNLATDPQNPGRPAISSLDLSYDLVPPLEHELISDGDGFEDSYQTYLANAADAAEVASSQLIAARTVEEQALLDTRADRALLAEAELAEAEVISEACGSGGGCDLDRRAVVTLGALVVGGSPLVTAPAATEIPGYVGESGGDVQLTLDFGSTTINTTCSAHLATFTSGFSLDGRVKHDWDAYTESYLKAGLGCMRHVLLLAAHGAERHEVPEIVIEELAAGGSGQFRESSGEVREALITTFADIIELRDALRSFNAMYTAAIAEIENGARNIDQLTPSGDESALCHIGQALAIAGAAIGAAVVTVATFGTGAAAIVAAIVVVAVAVAAGGVNWVQSNCEGDTRPAQAEAQRTFANAVIAIENLQGVTDRVKLAAARVAIGDSRIDRLQRRADIARQRRAIRERVALTNSVTDLPEWHALHTYQVRRARRALFRAQQYSFIARRAVEYRFGVDLPVMTRSEPFVDSPASWVNELFVVDTATTADPDTPGTAHQNTSGEAITDWVQSLGDFVRGYPFARRFRDATDVQVLRLEHIGLDERTTPHDAPIYHRMMFKCAGAEAELLGGEPRPADPSEPWPIRLPCESLGGVEYAELPFTIPSELRGYLAQRLATGSYNYRHESIAINLDGSGIVDCEHALRPWECYGDGNIQYSLRQDGRVLIENHERELHSFLAEPGVILQGRALAAERVLTNPLSVADRSLISPFERRELWGRPLMGSYVLRIHGRPEINWERMEGIQMLLQYRYWTRQE